MSEYTEATETSWGSRLGSSIKGIFTGIGLFLLAIVLLFWGEGRYVKQKKAIGEAQDIAITIDAAKLDSANEGKLGVFHGDIKVNDEIVDPVFVTAPMKAWRINRKVEFYQWKEIAKSKTETKTGGKQVTTTTYSYQKDWVSSPIDSSSFKKASEHENPPYDPNIFRSETVYPEDVSFGAFVLPENKIRSISSQEKAILVSPEEIKEMPEAQDVAMASSRIAGSSIVYSFYTQPSVPAAKAVTPDTTETTTAAPDTTTAAPDTAATAKAATAATAYTPRIGDCRVTLSYDKAPEKATLLALQDGNSFKDYFSSNGRDVSYARAGIQSKEEVFASLFSSNNMMKWILRFVGLMMMFMGVKMVFEPLKVLSDVIPFFGSIADAGTSIIAWIISIPSASAIILLGMLFYRPFLAIFLGGILAVGLFFAITALRKGKKKSDAPAAEEAPALEEEPQYSLSILYRVT